MARYIDVELLKKNFAKRLNMHYGIMLKMDDVAVDLGLAIADTPTADVEEVKHAEWELKSEIYQMGEEFDEEFYVECPLCHRVEYVPFEFEEEKMLEYAKKHYPYCHCGAKMDGCKAE